MEPVINNQNNLRDGNSNSQLAFDLYSHLQSEKYVLRLYVADSNIKSVRAIQRIKNICEEHLKGRYELEVIDIYKEPERLEEDHIFAVPTLIKQLPQPLQRLIGDMTDTEALTFCLGL